MKGPKLQHIAVFALRRMHADVTDALRLADALGVAVPTGALTREPLRMAMQRGPWRIRMCRR
ncbi:MAG: hypothetical protein D6709_10120 [Chloroflexi bacterium]|uniref:Uncharacterized protein n=1 Tax=Candidatus Thermofonsia Clade 3 bacterium TaxID=2364212 RepID=A0A2M8QG11_9CHLR|nr:hypothetical protein [Candidatus Roseilinea sp. NK_OTU-006]PJF48746.1 MAG: hypothetical protein CUN48_02020 [Candidatus Thermofonsia Clade 3 bacterium]RMG62924.1 MAG: hypothetical protein D6709_10120 [Chloroflexota bacterium]